MSYDVKGGPYLIPNLPLATTTTAPVLLEMDIGASDADHGEMLCVRPCRVSRLKFTCVGELGGGTTTAPTVIFKKRPTPLSATGETAIGTLTIPDATAVGTTIFKDVEVALAVGDSIEISHTVGVDTPTGKGFWSVELDDAYESHQNNSELIESA